MFAFIIPIIISEYTFAFNGNLFTICFKKLQAGQKLNYIGERECFERGIDDGVYNGITQDCRQQAAFNGWDSRSCPGFRGPAPAAAPPR